jgi:VWFA-related protein
LRTTIRGRRAARYIQKVMKGLTKPIRLCAGFLLSALSASLGSQILPAQEANSIIWAPAMFATEGFIRLDLSVTDRSGNPVTGLAPDDFKLLDNGQPTEILSVHAFNGTTAKPDPPIEIILVFDEQSAFALQVAAAARQIAEFFQRMKEPVSAPVSILRISNREVVETPRTSTDGTALARVVMHPAQSDFVRVSPERSPADLKGLPLGLGALGAVAIRARRSPGRKLLFWIGPGWGGELRGSAVADWITEFSTRLREARITVYCATGLFSPERAPVQDSSLKNIDSPDPSLGLNLSIESIARRSGGSVLQLNNLDAVLPAKNDLTAVLAKKIKEASAYYSLTFAVPRTSQVDDYHELKLEVDKPDLTVNTSSGYFDEPVYYDQPPPVQHVTIAQFEQMLPSVKQMSDRECASKIDGVELAERMSSARLHSWEARMPGKRSRGALRALADLSAFLDPPPDEVVTRNPPDSSAQRQMLARTVDYLNHAIPRLPDFSAVRTTVLLNQKTPGSEQTWKTAIGDQSLRAAETTKTSIVLRHGKEVVEKEASRSVETLRTEGAFGPVLAIAYTAATSTGATVKWLRWERDANGLLAVFAYSLSGGKALFETGFCCLADGDGRTSFLRLPPVHGELAIDPASGAIFRMTAMADLTSRLPLDRSALSVEYNRLTIGGNVYVCPVRSVSFQRQRTIRAIDEWGETFRIYGPFETILNDMTFEKYHLFHSNVQILPGFTPTGNPQ